MNKKIAIIGCGNLGSSILKGFLNNSHIDPQNLTVTRRNVETLEEYTGTGVKITNDNLKAVKDSEIIILALKPYTIFNVLREIGPAFVDTQHIVVSLASGVSLQALQENIRNPIPIFRAMPNTASDVAMSMTCLCSNTNDQATNELIEHYFKAVGSTITINEELMNSATVLGACGTAFVLRFIRGMIQGGIQIGFDSKTASLIATQTVRGAAELLSRGNQHPESEIDKVTTPKGCTIAGLNEMEHNGFSSALIKGIVASFNNIQD